MEKPEVKWIQKPSCVAGCLVTRATLAGRSRMGSTTTADGVPGGALRTTAATTVVRGVSSKAWALA